MKKILGISLGILGIDQILKFVVRKNLEKIGAITLIPGFFKLEYARNDGAAWSLFAGSRLFLILMTIIFLVLIYFLFLKNQTISNWEKYAYGFLIGGILGNFIDRLFLGYVIDYLSFIIVTYPFPIFNFADICIVLSMFYLVFKSSEEVLLWKLK